MRANTDSLQVTINNLISETGVEFDRNSYAGIISNRKLSYFVFDKIKKKEFPIDIASFTSMISRCIENNLEREFLIATLEFCKDMNISGPLYLRRVRNIDYLILAANYGFHDIELTKRIVTLQRKFRRETLTVHSFEGENPGGDKYFGYRHSLYFIRYNRAHRLELFKNCNWGDCNWQAYVDYLGDKLDREVTQKIKNKR